MNTELEAIIRTLTEPLNGQYPRPWMTELQDPRQAKVFIVGKNQAKTFPAAQVGTHELFLDALFNRNGQSCRRLYDRLTAGRPSPTRQNIDRLNMILKRAGVREILETNVICYSTGMSPELDRLEHAGGKDRGRVIFRTLLEHVRPPVIIAHGADTRRELARVLGEELPECPERPDPVTFSQVDPGEYRPWVFIIPSLAPPAYKRWSGWADPYLQKVAGVVVRVLGQREVQEKAVCQDIVVATPAWEIWNENHERRYNTMTHASAQNHPDEWVQTFLKWMRIYGSGEQTSRVSFCLPQNSKRFCKLEIPGNQRRAVLGTPSARDRVLSLMFHNYGLNPRVLLSELEKNGYPGKLQAKYLEVHVRTQEDAKKVLRTFVSMLPLREQIRID